MTHQLIPRYSKKIHFKTKVTFLELVLQLILRELRSIARDTGMFLVANLATEDDGPNDQQKRKRYNTAITIRFLKRKERKIGAVN